VRQLREMWGLGGGLWERGRGVSEDPADDGAPYSTHSDGFRVRGGRGGLRDRGLSSSEDSRSSGAGGWVFSSPPPQ
jgi:hypothetical protein